MKRNPLSLAVTLALLTTAAAFAMKYDARNALPIVNVPVDLFHRPVNNFSGCSSDSNTIAVGYEIYSAGFRMLCADAGRIGFWTAPVAAALVGQESQPAQRFLCPSGTALGGVMFVEGLTFPLPLCGELIPDFGTGNVRRTVLFTVDKVVIEKESKGPPVTPGVVSCGPAGFVQSLQASRNAAGAVTGFGTVCNSILTTPANKDDVSVDLAVRTVDQRALLGRNSDELFRVDVFNLGIAGVPVSNVSLELRFDGSAWQIQEFADTVCSDILGHKGVVDLIVIGKRCTVPGTVLSGRGGEASAHFVLQPLGPEALRPPTATPQSIFSVKVNILDDRVEGPDANDTNDRAAFPVVLQ